MRDLALDGVRQNGCTQCPDGYIMRDSRLIYKWRNAIISMMINTSSDASRYHILPITIVVAHDSFFFALGAKSNTLSHTGQLISHSGRQGTPHFSPKRIFWHISSLRCAHEAAYIGSAVRYLCRGGALAAAATYAVSALIFALLFGAYTTLIELHWWCLAFDKIGGRDAPFFCMAHADQYVM